ncbi:MAG: bifunctional 5,10-methylenetetrahydrofolate dehydrogenase/5,10-methenyltetrahydrofolate cyclohydrolase [Candidatus Altiarchaeota archaeon]
MAAIVLDGRKLAKKIRAGLKKEVNVFSKESGVVPGLATVIVGDNPSSRLYVSMKHTACEEVGFMSQVHELPDDITEEELIGVIDKLNNTGDVHGILVQLPLPEHINTAKIISLINPDKDVDGFSPVNQGLLASGDERMVSATPLGVIRLLEEYKITLEGLNAVIVNHSLVVGRPMAQLLLNRDATVTVCHVKTRDLKSHTLNADLLISATGVPHLIKEDMVQDGAVVVDVGVARKGDSVVGDVDYENVRKKASHITPVPGGTGPMTIACLLENTMKAAKSITLDF